MESPSKIKLREPLLVLVTIVLLIWWSINAFNTGNALWFLPFQPLHQPGRIISDGGRGGAAGGHG